jgi:hypothetical protein
MALRRSSKPGALTAAATKALTVATAPKVSIEAGRMIETAGSFLRNGHDSGMIRLGTTQPTYNIVCDMTLITCLLPWHNRAPARKDSPAVAFIPGKAAMVESFEIFEVTESAPDCKSGSLICCRHAPPR